MTLISNLFNGDVLLESAATVDSAHIQRGDFGNHVKKIQLALKQLDGVKLDTDSKFGPATAAAVLAFKKKRNIINRQYQSTPDDIVGKMTMAALDRELVAIESLPSTLTAIQPPANLPRSSARFQLGFAVTGTFSIGSGVPPSAFPTPAPVVAEVVIAPGQQGSISMKNGIGGILRRTQASDVNADGAIVLLLNPNFRGVEAEEVDVETDPQLFNYRGGSSVGESFFQWTLNSTPPKRSGIIRVLVLVRSAGPATQADSPVHPQLKNKTGLVSTELVPLNPLPGRKINIFGRGESNGFEDYSSSLPFCNDSGGRRKPWTNDPRKPDVGISDKSVKNISIRSSPVKQVTIDEIKRIAAQGCRVTCGDGSGSQVKIIRAAFVDNGLARLVDETTTGNAIVFEII